MKSLRALVALSPLVLATLPLACAAQSQSDVGESSVQNAEALQADYSYVGQSVIAKLQSSDASARLHTWNASTGNTFNGDWLMQAPLSKYWGAPLSSLPVTTDCDPNADASCDPDFLLRACNTDADCIYGGTCTTLASTVWTPGDAPYALCAGHSDALVDDVYTTITSAQRFVDITSLSAPDGRFLAAIRNGLTFLSQTGRSIEVRVLVGNYPGEYSETTAMLHDLTRDLPSGTALSVSVAAYRYGLDSWNHAKIVAVDGRRAIVGGMNLWTQHYLNKDAVHDVSIRLDGPAAGDAHRFANELWNFTCNSWSFGGSTQVTSYPGDTSRCPAMFNDALASVSGGAHVIAVGRLGKIGNEAADDAILSMIGAAKKTVYLAQQDLGPVQKGGIALASWPAPLLDQLARALARGVDVYLVLSNQNSTAGGLGSVSGGYSNGYSAATTAGKIADYARAHANYFASGTDFNALLCTHLHVAPLRSSSDDMWPDGTPLALHAKTLIIDGIAFYVGSQNLYPANLAEYGFIVDDAATAQTYVDGFWANAWKYSSRVAVSGSETTSCQIKK